MAFFGILILSWIMMMIIFFVIAVFLFVFIPCLVISIINLVKGIQNHWPTRNIIFLSLTGSVVIILIFLFTFFVLYLTSRVPVNNNEESTSSAATLVNQIVNIYYAKGF